MTPAAPEPVIRRCSYCNELFVRETAKQRACRRPECVRMTELRGRLRDIRLERAAQEDLRERTRQGKPKKIAAMARRRIKSAQPGLEFAP